MKAFRVPNSRYKKPQNRKPLLPTAIENKKSLTQLLYGEVGVQVCEAGWLTARQIEATRIILKRSVRNEGDFLWIRVRPTKPVTAKTQGMRMGKGKGAASFWVLPVKIGRVLFELHWHQVAKTPLLKAFRKLPMKTRMLFNAQSFQHRLVLRAD